MSDENFLMAATDEDRYVATSLGRLGEALLVTNPRTYMHLLAFTNVGYYLIQNGSFIVVTPGLAKMLSYTMEELLDIRPLELVSPEDREMVSKVTDELSWEEKQSCRFTCRLITKGGQFIPVQIENIPIKLAAQRAYHGLVINSADLVGQDVTSQLRRSEERFKLAASLASDLIYEENARIGELFWHGDIDSLLGYAPGTFPRTTKSWKQTIVQEMLPDVQKEIDRCTAQAEPFRLEYQVQKQDGSRLWIRERGKNLVDDEGNIIRCIGTITDVTSLKQANEALRQSEERFRLLAENARDIIFSVQIKPKLKFEYLSPALTAITGYLPEEFYNSPRKIFQVADPEHQGLLKSILQNKGELNRPWRASWRGRGGSVIWTEQNASALRQGDRVVLQGVARDITANKQLEDNMRYITTHDVLTGLMNRVSFEEQLSRAHADKNPWSLIIFDLDGLKLINDTLGHQAGDSLLQAAGRIISQADADQHLVARIGGDEFALLIPGDDMGTLQRIMNTIKQSVDAYNREHYNTFLSISMGYAIGGVEDISNADLFKEADNSMYRQKLLNSQSIRSSIIKGLNHTLKARDLQTEDHGERMQALVLRLARAVPLSESRMNDLILLAQFHDIGKVGIPDQILFKPGILNESEFETMKRHSEIGFRIAQSVADLVPVSDWILKHHEWWNGEGYPLGLKQDDIPIECRVLSIVDAYDAMTHHRPYRQAMPKEKAIKELLAGAGSQFDPRLVKLFVDIIERDDV